MSWLPTIKPVLYETKPILQFIKINCRLQYVIFYFGIHTFCDVFVWWFSVRFVSKRFFSLPNVKRVFAQRGYGREHSAETTVTTDSAHVNAQRRGLVNHRLLSAFFALPHSLMV